MASCPRTLTQMRTFAWLIIYSSSKNSNKEE